jgi:hypothetical protein
MSIRSRRARILTNLQKQLQTITVANGYSRSVHTVTTDVKSWQDTPEAETPVIYIIDNQTNPKHHAGKLIEWEWSVSLFCVMKNRSQIEMEEFVSDVMECVEKNRTLADLTSGAREVSNTRVDGIVTDGQFFSVNEGSQLFRVDLTIFYTACVDAIR